MINTDEDTIGCINTIKFLKEKQMIARQTFAMVLSSNVDNAVEKLADSMNIKNENKEEFNSIIDGWKNETSGDDFDSAEELFDFLKVSYL